jgi:hypothetical protein
MCRIALLLAHRNLDPNHLPFFIAPENLFLMQNSAFSSDPSKWRLLDAQEWGMLSMEWDKSMRTMLQLLARVASLSAVSTTDYQVSNVVIPPKRPY